MMEARFRNARRYRETEYHTFTLIRQHGWSADDCDDAMKAVERWCVENLPIERDIRRCRVMGWSVRVLNEPDAFAFKMRWC